MLENNKFSNLVSTYFENYKENEPILIEEVKKYFKNITKSNYKNILNKLYVYINRLIKQEKLKVYIKGVYYKGTITEYQIIEKKYIKENDNIKGYITGDSLLYELRLTKSKPEYVDLISNVCYKGSRYKNNTLNVIVHKPRIEVNNENYKYLELLELIKLNQTKEIIYKFIEENNLKFQKIFEYASLTRNKKLIEKLF